MILSYLEWLSETRSIERSLCDSWASCLLHLATYYCWLHVFVSKTFYDSEITENRLQSRWADRQRHWRYVITFWHKLSQHPDHRANKVAKVSSRHLANVSEPGRGCRAFHRCRNKAKKVVRTTFFALFLHLWNIKSNQIYLPNRQKYMRLQCNRAWLVRNGSKSCSNVRHKKIKKIYTRTPHKSKANKYNVQFATEWNENTLHKTKVGI